jgi:hypothetical protein
MSVQYALHIMTISYLNRVKAYNLSLLKLLFQGIFDHKRYLQTTTAFW